MLIRLIIGLGVFICTCASVYLNFSHVQNLGAGIIGLVIGAELIKFSALGALYANAQNEHWGGVFAALVLWFIAVAFSLTNTFGASLSRHAEEYARIERDRESGVRAEHVIRQEIAGLAMCGKGKSRKICDSEQPRLDALNAEIVAARKKGADNSGDAAAYVRGDPVREGIIELAKIANINIPKHRVYLWVTLLWTLLAEIGSAIGVVAIPNTSRKATK